MLNHCLRAFVTGSFFAALALSIVLATSDYDAAARSAAPPLMQSRAIGTATLTYNNPVFAQNLRDLGDAAQGAGSVITTRYLRAKGGVTPYIFDIDKATTPELLSCLAPNGWFSGNLNMLPAGLVYFDGTVTDSSWALVLGTSLSHTESFRLNIAADGNYRFAKDQLCTAQTYRGYVDNLAAINGHPPYTFTASNITMNGNPITDKEEMGRKVGLWLAPDGTLFGRPIQFGTLQFLASCIDHYGFAAYTRDGKQGGQFFTLQIESNLILSSEVTTTQLRLQHNKNGTTTLNWKGMVNLNGATISSLAGQDLEVRVGNYVSPGGNTFDDTGKLGILSKHPAFNARSMGATIDAWGRFKISIQDFTLWDKENVMPYFEAQKTADTRLTSTFLRIGATVMDSNFHSFTRTDHGGTSYFYASVPYGGDFMLLRVKGKDAKHSGGTQWSGTYNLRPFYKYNPQRNLYQPAPVDNPHTLVNVGADYVGKAAGVIWGGGKFKTPNINSAGMPGLQTGIPLAHAELDAAQALFGLKAQLYDATGNFLFSAETSCAIFAHSHSWLNLNPRK